MVVLAGSGMQHLPGHPVFGVFDSSMQVHFSGLRNPFQALVSVICAQILAFPLPTLTFPTDFISVTSACLSPMPHRGFMAGLRGFPNHGSGLNLGAQAAN